MDNDILELTRLTFEARAAVYRGAPTDAHYFGMCSSLPEKAEHAMVTEIVYSAAISNGFQLPVLAHLAKALSMEMRVQEAHYFCQKWLETEPMSLDGNRLAVLIACQRQDVQTAKTSFDALQSAGAPDATLWALETAMLLAFSDGASAPTTARYALGAHPPDETAKVVAWEAAFRTNDAALISEVLRLDATFAADNPARIKRAANLLREALLSLLSNFPGGAG